MSENRTARHVAIRGFLLWYTVHSLSSRVERTGSRRFVVWSVGFLLVACWREEYNAYKYCNLLLLVVTWSRYIFAKGKEHDISE